MRRTDTSLWRDKFHSRWSAKIKKLVARNRAWRRPAEMSSYYRDLWAGDTDINHHEKFISWKHLHGRVHCEISPEITARARIDWSRGRKHWWFSPYSSRPPYWLLISQMPRTIDVLRPSRASINKCIIIKYAFACRDIIVSSIMSIISRRAGMSFTAAV